MTPAPLIIWHSRTNASKRMAEAVHLGAGAAATCLRADEAFAETILKAPGYVFVCPENLASMSGLMKEMFDRTYYDVLGRVEGRPYATIIAAGSDGEGAQRQIDRIATGWRLKRIAEPIIINFNAQSPEHILAEKTVPSQVLQQCEELGKVFKEGLESGIF